MQTAKFDVPALYGDHHTAEVRKLLLALPGVTEVYASSAFQVVEVTFDPSTINDRQIAVKLDEAGYLSEWTPPIEPGIAQESAASPEHSYFRHTVVYGATPKTIAFAQRVAPGGRPLWPCPGFGPLAAVPEEESPNA
ncbi:MAG TPA: heavy-metal-associated domain-containing protein [Anaerolineales bacterium]|nr:heavy-metal-associated domain-containing protein [Anaerolineales bacterium]